jgi:hypothetical protein
VKRHTLGLFLGAYPCGVVVVWDKLYGSESISQVYGILIEYLSSLSKLELVHIIYDDACHIAKFSKKASLANRNEVTKFFSERTFSVDKFHFKVNPLYHLSQNINSPNVILIIIIYYSSEPCGSMVCQKLDDYNTEICEQMFRQVNQHRNCKSMNELRWFLFWFYQLDLHNLDMEGLASVAPNPHCDFRWSQLNITEVDFKKLPQIQTNNI